MEWQAIVLVVQILLLAVGWFLFQQARGELSARAQETPVLGEVKALQRSIKQLLADLEQASESASARVEKRCGEARHALDTLDARLTEASALRDALTHTLHAPARNEGQYSLGASFGAELSPALRDAVAVASQDDADTRQEVSMPAAASGAASARDRRRDMVFALADAGRPQGDIARETGLSEGEIEMLLALRLQRA